MNKIKLLFGFVFMVTACELKASDVKSESIVIMPIDEFVSYAVYAEVAGVISSNRMEVKKDWRLLKSVTKLRALILDSNVSNFKKGSVVYFSPDSNYFGELRHGLPYLVLLRELDSELIKIEHCGYASLKSLSLHKWKFLLSLNEKELQSYLDSNYLSVCSERPLGESGAGTPKK